MNTELLNSLEQNLEGDLFVDKLSTTLYATDASVYRKIPLAVALPETTEDIKTLIRFASENNIGLIPRTAGTSLAGQCVGDGIVVDVSKHFTKIISVDKDKRQVTVQPGVIRDELNLFLEPYGLFFGPNTSTSNRCMIGGMVGNNSSGTTSIQYGITREKTVSLKAILADGSEANFGNLTTEEFHEKRQLDTLEGKIYNSIFDELSIKETQQEIITQFPKPSIHRRNTGYAVDELLHNSVFGNEGSFNMCKLLSGSEGTLAFTTEITLSLDPIPPKYAAMVVTHYTSLEDCLADVVPVMEHQLHLCEMMDKVILDCTKNNRAQLANRFFVEGDPAALLMLELKAETKADLNYLIDSLLKTIKKSGLSYANPILFGDDIKKAVELRKAGLGLLGNMVGDKKAVACIEDTAVAIEDLKEFIGEFSTIMKGHNQSAVYYAHAGAGELHLRPILNLKKGEDVKLFRAITTDVAKLTKKYNGSFSGEHGDGIVRAEFIPLMIGEKNYQLLRRIKSYFDPKGIFNPGKIVDSYPMDESFRYKVDRKEPEIETLLDFSESEGILKAAEKCNGSGDCRKTEKASGAMCPSYHVTRNEKDTTRGRANTLREMLTNTDQANKFNQKELKEVFDLCLSCKACSSECPSNVDVATLKAEFSYQYQEANGYSFRNKLFAYNTKYNALGSKIPKVTNFMFNSSLFGGIIKNISGVAPERSLPNVYKFNFDKYLGQIDTSVKKSLGSVVLYIDEFTKYLDVNLGIDAIQVLTKLGYNVELFYAESGRTFISKGFLKEAKELALKNVVRLKEYTDKGLVIVGLEPSAILTFRDEYKKLVSDKDLVNTVAKNSFIIEEFLASEIEKGKISKNQFTKEAKTVKIHSHCHQKSLSNQKVTFDVLNIIENYKVSIISSGCCGMAGSFGYEKEHYSTSMAVGNLKLFPAVNNSDKDVIISANGTSCRHQIYDGTKRKALHPITIIKEALV
ncbi:MULTISPECIES: FAD-binding and (Fe-S)-binding domain-containing protein [Cellulophaga]|uniref:D-lactate dehydrogenase (Cytochrome) n=1 Tax=Cellulophaga lytica (strain ATCC 23178 / DSM 7489 / JCM 8516 / NBRC 14961 / NCIMB 1423 / VKM B-1433 / Cy l20) TaxID=867900 RepID=F0RBI8_CELLC|nr:MULTISPECIES: FAD-binding and (Fe-S)-binding domain-containing protein [Cellulophaga]ADY30638.1 D-lactate dehydrogenase (cytochrome) [Cellulophaga lytica DSM 7489]MDO6853113.1 FAD-binding and (Fe-S)-binding domain-containing protein [Cellulophaga lytica]TVZ10049.1 FAD/FMN-containing dehydrogenase [Cellulophaga sp. RHA_52]WQG78435.1 FAD-binding and (Fe-S)-binding domain-containing protein [Cellulophaga lytica]